MNTQEISNQLLYFENKEWTNTAIGVYQKIYCDGNLKIRLVHLTNNFIERDWCTKGHIGFIISGEMLVEFDDGNKRKYKTGDEIWITKTIKHKTHIINNNHVDLLFYEMG